MRSKFSAVGARGPAPRLLRLLAAVLAALLLLPMGSAFAPAARAEETELISRVITLRLGEEQTAQVQVYACGEDLLFSAADLSDHTDFGYECDGKTAVFTRGSKVVEVRLEDGRIIPLKGIASLQPMYLPVKPVAMGEEWYFSGAGLLPWLNVTLEAEDGCLLWVSDAVSFWDVYGQLDMERFYFSYGDLVTQYAYNSKVVKAMNYTDDSTAQALKESLRYEDEFDASAEDYFTLFEGILLDTAHNDILADAFYEAAGVLVDFASLLDKGETYSEIFKAFQIVSDGAIYAAHYAAFTRTHQDRLALVNTVLANRLTGIYTDQLVQGALLADNTYSSWWQGLLNQYVLKLDSYLADAILDLATQHPAAKVVLLALDVSTKEIQNLNKRIAFMPALFNLYSVGREVYEGVGTGLEPLEQRRCHGMLALYAAGENFRTLASYSAEHGLWDLHDTYKALAQESDLWLSDLTAASLSRVNDSINYVTKDGKVEGKQAYTQKLYTVFSRLEGADSPAGGLERLEYAILLAYVRDYPMLWGTWKLLDYDEDGREELILLANLEWETRGLVNLQADSDTFAGDLFIDDSDVQYDDPDLTDFLLPGDGDALLDTLQGYVEKRGQFNARNADIDGDGRQDRVFVLHAAADKWLDSMTFGYQPTDYLGYDTKLTLIAAMPGEQGLRLRVQRLFTPGADYFYADDAGWELDWDLQDGRLTVGEELYTYQAQGEPFAFEGFAEP